MKTEAKAFDIQEAWQGVGWLYSYIVSMFGAPFAIAEQLMFMRKDRRDLLSWLAPVEALARRILLLRALTLPKPNDPPAYGAGKGRVLTAFTDRPIDDIDPDSEKWRVRFCVMPHGMLRRKNAAAPRASDAKDQRGGSIDFNALPLARRLEALRRVLENPAPAAARLARLLATQREAVVSAFRPYRPLTGYAQEELAEVQLELTLALNSS